MELQPKPLLLEAGDTNVSLTPSADPIRPSRNPRHGQVIVKTENLDESGSSKSSLLECDQCDQIFLKKYNLECHIALTHTAGRKLICPECQRPFSSKNSIERHYLCMHLGERIFKCRSCKYRTTTKQNLDIHTRTHTGERPFYCPDCGKGHISRQYLQAHYDKVHLNAKILQCPHCPHQTGSQAEMERHGRHHEDEEFQDFICPGCDRSFPDRVNLEGHYAREHQDNPVICPHCPVQPKDLRTFQEHLITHRKGRIQQSPSSSTKKPGGKLRMSIGSRNNSTQLNGTSIKGKCVVGQNRIVGNKGHNNRKGTKMEAVDMNGNEINFNPKIKFDMKRKGPIMSDLALLEHGHVLKPEKRRKLSGLPTSQDKYEKMLSSTVKICI